MKLYRAASLLLLISLPCIACGGAEPVPATHWPRTAEVPPPAPTVAPAPTDWDGREATW